ncbi:succinyl-diaminopimelate desuccinylase [Ruminococcaceae bacterium YRB3002]|nr:succinyl-diaminopimelate desuccinylase [Ruminococcaceae bacterium YRB3002]
MSLNNYESSFVSKIIAIPSVGGSPEPGMPYGKAPHDALITFLKEAEAEGFRTGIIDDKVGYAEYGDGDRMIGIVCHLDVVPEGKGWETPAFELTEKDGAMYGRGIIDDKGPACASYFAMKRLKDSGLFPSCRVRLILGSDEERTCDCVATYAAKGEIPSFAITPDAEFPVIFAEKGILQIKLSDKVKTGITATAGSAPNMVPCEAEIQYEGAVTRTSGKTAHASRPELGDNAIISLVNGLDDEVFDNSQMLRFIKDNIAGADAVSFTGCTITDDSGSVTYNPAILRIDDEGESLVIDIRYPVSASNDDIISHISNMALPYGIDITELNHMKPLYKDKNTSEIRILTEIWAENMHRFDGFKPEYKDKYSEPIAVGGGTYARHLPNTIAFGPQAPWAEDQCHQANEHLSVNDFEVCIDMISEYIKRLGSRS